MTVKLRKSAIGASYTGVWEAPRKYNLCNKILMHLKLLMNTPSLARLDVRW